MREFALLERVFKSNATLPSMVTVPPGDDMGAVRIGGVDVLAGVDQLADGVHFDLRETTIERVAYKALARSVSDVAAMAAVPDGALVTAALPRDFGEGRAAELTDALQNASRRLNCPLFGGDVLIWDEPLLLTVNVIAHCQGNNPVLRSGATPGDVVFVTGTLGGSLIECDGRVHHLDFEPRVELARTLASGCGVKLTSMIDLSDGLARDLGHICERSKVRATVEIAKLPISDAARVAAAADGREAWRHAIGDGEDYELCFTVIETDASKLPDVIDGVSVTAVGRIGVGGEASHAIELLSADGSVLAVDTDDGFEHRGH